MSGRDHIQGKRGMPQMAEAMEQLHVYSLLHSYDDEVFSELFDKIDELVNMMRNSREN